MELIFGIIITIIVFFFMIRAYLTIALIPKKNINYKVKITQENPVLYIFESIFRTFFIDKKALEESDANVEDKKRILFLHKWSIIIAVSLSLIIYGLISIARL